VETYGIEPDRLAAAGFGESRPVDENDTPEGRQNNRRVELVKLD
jgi:flagellar motor protein MotB